MSRSSFRFVLFGLLFAAAWWFGRASGDEVEGDRAWSPTSVAIIDMGRIFKDSPRLARLRDELKQDFETESVGVKALADGLKPFQERAKAAQGNEQELKSIKEEFDKKAAEVREAMAKLQKDFITREIEVYRSFYGDVQPVVESYAKERGIRLVMRYQQSQEPPAAEEIKDAKDVSAIMNNLNQLVVYHDALDITDTIIQKLKDDGSY